MKFRVLSETKATENVVSITLRNFYFSIGEKRFRSGLFAFENAAIQRQRFDNFIGTRVGALEPQYFCGHSRNSEQESKFEFQIYK